MVSAVPALGRGATATWSNGAGGTFGEASNWNGGAGPAPGASDHAQFNLAGSFTTTFAADAGTSALTVGGSNVTFVTDGSPRTYNVGNMQINSGSVTLGASPAALTLNAGAPFTKIASGASLSVLSGNHFNAANGLDIAYNTVSQAQSTSNLIVDGTGSSIGVTNLTRIANLGGFANINFSNNATGSFRDVFTYGGANNGTGANWTIQSGADVTAQGYFQWGTGQTRAANTFNLLVTGAGSTLVQTNGGFGVGSSVGPTTLTIANGGSVSTAASYGININASGTVDFTGGTLNTNGAITIAGGTLKRTTTSGTLNWTGGQTMNISAGGMFNYAGNLTYTKQSNAPDQININVSGTNSRFITGGLFTAEGSKVNVNVTTGGSLQPATLTVKGASGVGANVVIDGAGSSLVTGTTTIGGSFDTGNVTIRNGATATFSGDILSFTGTQGKLSIESGAVVSARSINHTGASNLVVTGAGSTLNQEEAGIFTVGGNSGTAKITVSNGGVINTGNIFFGVLFGADINAGNGGTLNINSNVSMSGGSLTRFKLEPGVLMTVTGGVATATSSPFMSNEINVSGPGQFGTENLNLEGGTALKYESGAAGSVINLHVGAAGAGGTLTITGTNSRLNSVFAANHTIGAPSGTAGIVYLNNSGALSLFGGGTTTVKPTGWIVLNGGTLAGGNLVLDGGHVNFNSGTVTVGPTVSVSNGGKLDMRDNAMTVTGGDIGTLTGNDYSGILGLVQSGRGDGTWNGSGIMTSMPDADTGLTTLAVSTWGADVRVQYTFAGDANLDGRIDADDYFEIDSHYGGDPALASYARGDFNYSGAIDGDDYFLIDANYPGQFAPAPTGVTAVPEPQTAFVSVCMLAIAVRRRKRRP